jgi:hypothetical protein
MTIAVDDWIARARAVPIEGVAARLYGLDWKSRGHEMAWPCPACGGHDRFSINRRKQVFHCRASGEGGDVIAMVRYLDACDFNAACERITGEARPDGAGGVVDEAEQRRRAEQRAAEHEKREHEARDYREAERRRMWKVWQEAVAIRPVDPVGRYLAARGIATAAVSDARLKLHPALPYFALDGKRPREVFKGPAMVGAIIGPDGRFRGAHLTWIDPATHAKAEIADPETREVLAPKKVRGSAGGNHIPLSRNPVARRLVVGEGIETVLSVKHACSAEMLPGWMNETLFVAGISLGNIGGRAMDTIPHPTATRTDKLGRVRKQRVPNDQPDRDPRYAALMPPEEIEDVILLGDGDSDRFTTEMTLRRAAARWARPGRVIKVAWAPQGRDWNDVLRGK